MFEMKATVLISALVLISSLPYINGEIPGSVPVKPQAQKVQITFSANEYVNQMGPNTGAWHRQTKIQEASAEPLK